MMRSLWFKLSVCFTAITLGGILLFTLLFNVIGVTKAFDSTVTPETIAAIALSEQESFSKALRQTDSFWMALVEQKLVAKLCSIKFNDEGNEKFSIDMVVKPEIYVTVADSTGKIVYNTPGLKRNHLESIFRESKGKDSVALFLKPNNTIFVKFPLLDEAGAIEGTVSVVFSATLDKNKFVIDFLNDYAAEWLGTLIACAFIALPCGLIANLFVSRPLKSISNATNEWYKGNFSSRINVASSGGDILAEHSRQLNAMADEMEKLLILKEQTAAAEERNRMASELHDTVKQNLFGLNLQLAAIKYKNTASNIVEHIDEAERIIRESQQDIMGILAHFYTPDQPKKSLCQHMELLTENIARRYDVTVSWTKEDIPDLPKQQEQIVLRLTQEAISNAIRHGKATKIVLTLFTQNAHLFWSIADNGNGLPPGCDLQTNPGLGLSFMRKRVQDMPEGKFAIITGAEGGITVSAQWRVKA